MHVENIQKKQGDVYTSTQNVKPKPLMCFRKAHKGRFIYLFILFLKPYLLRVRPIQQLLIIYGPHRNLHLSNTFHLNTLKKHGDGRSEEREEYNAQGMLAERASWTRHGPSPWIS